jgi:hypothetical protein
LGLDAPRAMRCLPGATLSIDEPRAPAAVRAQLL